MQSGTMAPPFKASAYNSFTKEVGDVDLSSFKGKYTVLLFYTGNFGPSLLVDLMSFQEATKKFEISNEVHLLAISTDTVASHMNFGELSQEEGGLQGQEIILVEDKTGEISRKYHVYDAAHHKALPSYIIIDDEGEVVASIINDKKVGGNIHEVVRIISACILCAEEGAWTTLRGTPSDWKPGMKLVTTVVDNTGTAKKKEAPTKATVKESTFTEESLPEEQTDNREVEKVKLAMTLNDHLEEAEEKKQDETTKGN